MSDREAMAMARDLVRGSIIEDAASRFISQVLKEAHDSRIKPLRARIEELEAENARLWEALAEAVYMIAPEAEDILKGAGIYRIVLAYRLSGGVLPNDLKDALQEVKEKSDE